MMHWEPNQPSAGGTRIEVNVADEAALMADLRARLEQGQGFQVATLNLDHVVKLRAHPDFMEAYGAHSHVTADGNPIVWLSRLAGQKTGLLPGSDLVVPLAQLAADTGRSVALVGTSDSALAGAAQALTGLCPGLQIVTRIAPPMGFDPTSTLADSYIEQLGESGAGMCFLALGAPKQEIFAARAGARVPHMGFVSIGAGLDFLAGQQRRAPKLARLLAAEWAWRLLSDPKRLAGRYAACFAVLPGMTLRALSTRLRRMSAG